MLQHLRYKPTKLPTLAQSFLAKPTIRKGNRVHWHGWLHQHGRWMYLVETIGPHNPPDRADHHWFENDEVAQSIDVSVVGEMKAIKSSS